MFKHNTKILAIDPGTRYIGVAFLEGEKLIYHGVNVIKEKSPRAKLKAGKQITIQLIKNFSPDILVVERSFFGKGCNSSLLNVLVDKIEAMGRKNMIEVLSYAPTTVRKHICGNGWADKKALSQVIVARYPELRIFLTQDKAWKEQYHQNMFDAVALGLMALSKIMGKRNPRGI
ncbi:crossover junction endodeoxyribonuclease RuvC [Candidatus Poribacteria bacterium]|nr:crossover junction endodeoxyribonuclease RuvC [Candidatus Poribacteria bacterium]